MTMLAVSLTLAPGVPMAFTCAAVALMHAKPCCSQTATGERWLGMLTFSGGVSLVSLLLLPVPRLDACTGVFCCFRSVQGGPKIDHGL